MKVSPLAGKPAEASMLVNVPKLITAYYTEIPDPSAPEQRVSFGTSGHRGSAFKKSFNEWHVPVISQAICLYRRQHKLDGPLFLDMDAIRGAKISLGVDPLGAAGVHYWAPIAEHYGLNRTVVNKAVDPTFRFMTVDWDGQIRMDPSSPYAMQRLIDLKDRFEIAFACDTDHDRHGIVPALLAAQITARMGRDPGEIYGELTREFGEPVYDRVEAPATPEQKATLERLSAQQVRRTDLAGEKIRTILTHAPGNDAPIGGLKVIAESGWFAARPSGTEDIYKIYAESFRGADHLRRILEEAQTIVNDALAVSGHHPGTAAKTNSEEKS